MGPGGGRPGKGKKGKKGRKGSAPKGRGLPPGLLDPNATGGTLEVEAPYGVAGGNTTVEVGGLSPNANYAYAIDGATAVGTTSDAPSVRACRNAGRGTPEAMGPRR